jgi:hypothetical protein
VFLCVESLVGALAIVDLLERRVIGPIYAPHSHTTSTTIQLRTQVSQANSLKNMSLIIGYGFRATLHVALLWDTSA